MPPHPDNVEERLVISDDYQDDKVWIEFYTNTSVAIGRGEEGPAQDRVWLDGKEKHGIFDALANHLGEVEEVTVEITK